MRKKYDLAVKTGEYTKNGEQKAKWRNIGVVLEGDKGPYILLDRTFNPAGVAGQEGEENIIVSCFPPREENTQQASADEYKNRSSGQYSPPSYDDDPGF